MKRKNNKQPEINNPRRFFLKKMTQWVSLVCFGGLLARCGSDSGNTKSFTNVADSTGEEHQITVNCTVFSEAQTQDQTFTSSALGHTHTVTLTTTQLTNIRNGNSVSITSSVGAGHTHVWTFSSC